MENRKTGRIILIVVFVLLCIITLNLFNYKNKSVSNNTIYSEEKYKLLKDYSRFYTVNSCIYKYISYLQSKDVNSLLLILDNDYIVSNNINDNNILDNLGILEGINSFVSKKIYYEELDDSIYKYYVYGYILEESINGSGNKTYKYYTVTMDIEKQLFTIAPYSGKVFNEVKYG